MEVILLDRVPKLGELGTKVRVKAGFARNFLIPKGKALPATEANTKHFEARRAELEKIAFARLDAAKQRALVLDGLVIRIEANAGDEGRLFGSVGAHEIVHAVKALGHELTKSELSLPEGPIRQIGEYEVKAYLEGDEVTATIRVSVIPV